MRPKWVRISAIVRAVRSCRPLSVHLFSVVEAYGVGESVEATEAIVVVEATGPRLPRPSCTRPLVAFEAAEAVKAAEAMEAVVAVVGVELVATRPSTPSRPSRPGRRPRRSRRLAANE